ncbi:hypothetical protein HYH03_005991 [Edaphochlamys debaryana]|uniref:CCHC-type domain-containing protein n=1 Tax=Edaphochlamys debaryana TaxID=47281 RepID=A0A835Y6P2_9CHLO|nr:hypothetical protein HYH03_005991 [Edaphochlamys debaryana]|eukprot:KAG2496072.1 hypothetical protein HYH03_005991 [Edaphochlamys debaryana]
MDPQNTDPSEQSPTAEEQTADPRAVAGQPVNVQLDANVLLVAAMAHVNQPPVSHSLESRPATGLVPVEKQDFSVETTRKANKSVAQWIGICVMMIMLACAARSIEVNTKPGTAFVLSLVQPLPVLERLVATVYKELYNGVVPSFEWLTDWLTTELASADDSIQTRSWRRIIVAFAKPWQFKSVDALIAFTEEMRVVFLTWDTNCWVAFICELCPNTVAALVAWQIINGKCMPWNDWNAFVRHLRANGAHMWTYEKSDKPPPPNNSGNNGNGHGSGKRQHEPSSHAAKRPAAASASGSGAGPSTSRPSVPCFEPSSIPLAQRLPERPSNDRSSYGCYIDGLKSDDRASLSKDHKCWLCKAAGHTVDDCPKCQTFFDKGRFFFWKK